MTKEETMASDAITLAKVERRGFLKALGLGAGAAAGGVAADVATAPAEAQESRSERTKARYKADSPHIQAFYRTNRY
jgi:hypothetical protein